MFIEFLYPLGLLAALGIGIPIVIHLWQVKQQRVLRVGNIKVFAGTKRQRIHKIRIKNWLLLAIRCLIVLLLAALLAGPRLVRDAGKQDRGWVLLGAGARYGAMPDPAQQQLIDSLLDHGYALHAFEPGFRPLPREDTEDTVATVDNQFTLVHTLGEQLPPGFPVVVFSTPQIGQLAGDVPATPLRLSWQVLATDTAEAARFITHAWKTSDDSVAVWIATSRPDGTDVARTVITGDGRAEGIAFRITDGQAEVSMDGQDEWVTVADRPYRIQFTGGSNTADLAYVQAVFRAFAQQTGIPVQLDGYDPSAPCDLLFDFSASPSADTDSQPATIFRYAAGEGEPQNNRLALWGTATNGDQPGIHRLIPADGDHGEVVWTDAYGQPVLTRQRTGSNWEYHFYSRFNPQWTDMVWSTEMINNLLPLLLTPETPLWTQSFERYAANRQVLPGPLQLPRQPALAGNTYHDREPTAIPLFTWAVLLIFALERILTHNQRRKQTDG